MLQEWEMKEGHTSFLYRGGEKMVRPTSLHESLENLKTKMSLAKK